MSNSFQHWSTQQVIDYVTNSNLPQGPKNKIIETIRQNDADGASLYKCRSADEIKDSLTIPRLHADKLFDLLKPKLQISENREAVLESLVEQQERNQSKSSNKSTTSTSILSSFSQLFFATTTSTSSNSQIREQDGFKLNFMGNRGKLDVSRMSFLKSDTMHTVKQHYIECINDSNGDIANVDLMFSGKPVNDNNRTLESYGITVTVTLLVSFKTSGGLAQYWDNSNNQEERYANFKNEKRIKPSLAPDCIMGYDEQDTLRVEMPCSHVFAPLTLFQFLKMVAERPNIKYLTCPVPKCNEKWEFEVVSAAAGLNEQEINKYGGMIYSRIFNEDGMTKPCPNCKIFCQRPNDLTMFRVNCTSCKGNDWCWSCGKKWSSNGMTICGNAVCGTKSVNETLATARKITPSGLNKVQVPSMRACPRCLTIVTYKDACKHMRCWSCQKRFCFVCLALESEDGKWACNAHNYECSVAAIQVLK